ncbi:MAG: ShlB/FhaC/HecB family hemolysin secretion/activation protein [Arcobacteraceae bacterium]|nr:ShlB/FhaC/HecB family hemolysin secretion/activation protein [Arcobacteraceae bacterium]
MNKIQLSIITTTLLVGSSLLGATPPSSSDILRQAKPVTIEKKESIIPEIKAPSYKAPMVADKGLKIGVKGFTISNNTVFSDKELQELIKEYVGKELTFNQLNEVASIITKHYRNKGYFVARAYIPAQELSKTDAIVEIAIVEGLYGNFTIQNSSLVQDKSLHGYMNKLTNGEVISSKSLDRQMLIIDDLSGVSVTNIEILPGSEVGKSDFNIKTEAEPKYTGYAIADNYGSRYTGEYRLNVAGNINSLTKRGDTLGLSVLGSNTAEMKNGRLSYSTPLGYSGFTLDSSLAFTTYELGKEFENLDIKGKSTVFDIGVNYPIIKTRTHTLETSLIYTFKNSVDEDNYQANREKNINSAKLSLSDSLKTVFFGKSGMAKSSISLTAGKVNLNDYAKTIDTINADGGYSKLNLSFSQNQSLTRNLSLLGSVSGQIALERNLDGGEDFSAGGAYGVRAYTDSELSGDKGYLASLELSYQLPVLKGINHSISTFLDHAKVWDNKEDVASVSPQSRLLSDVGVGYNLAYKDLSLKLSYAHGFGPKDERTPTADGTNTNLNRAFVQAMMRF